MAETITKQKNWRFTPEILEDLKLLCKKNRRSEQNMVEVLIHQEYERVFGGAIIQVDGNLIESSRVPVVES